MPKLYIDNFGSEVNGLVSSINALFVYLNLFEAGVGSASTQALFKPVSEKNYKEINEILAATKIYYRKAGRYGLLCILLLSSLYPIIAKSSLDYWLIGLLFLITGSSFIIKFFIQGNLIVLLHADNKAYVLTHTAGIFNVLMNIVKIVLIFLGFNIITVQLAFLLINFLQAYFIFIYINRKYQYLDLSEKPNYTSISQKSSVLTHQLATLILYNADAVILSMFCDLKVVSVYSVYNQLIYLQMLFIPQSLTDGITASLGQTYSKNINAFRNIYDLYENLYIMITFALLTVALLLTTPFVSLYTKNATDILYVDNALPLLFFISTILNALRTSNFLLIHVAGKYRETQKSAVIEASVHIGISIILVGKMGIYGVLLGTIVSLLYRVTAISPYVDRQILERKNLVFIKRLIVTMMPAFVVCLVYQILNISIVNYIDFTIVGFLLFASMSLMILFSNILFDKNFKVSLVQLYYTMKGK